MSESPIKCDLKEKMDAMLRYLSQIFVKKSRQLSHPSEILLALVKVYTIS